MRERVRSMLLVVAVLCFIAFLTFGMKGKLTADREFRQYSVGLPQSPWFVRTFEAGPGWRNESTRITLASWSWLVLAGGLVLLGIRNLLRPASTSAGGMP